ncbi:MAG: glycosyltransferase family 10 [Prochlorococcus marinus CUG1436]|nr:glycosyltransferase family 10 [Prochlorococcus marinus CUG1436]
MRVGIISYYDYFKYVENKDKYLIYENWNKAWDEVFKLSKKNNIKLVKYNFKDHKKYNKLLFIEIPRVNELIKVLYANLFKKKVHTLLLINETFLGRARYILRIPFLFNEVLINCEEKIEKFLSYKVNTFSYPSIPSKKIIQRQKSKILNSDRKNKLVFISSFKMALSRNGSYKFRYKLVKDLIKYKNLFDLYGYGWDKVPLPFDIIGIALIIRVKFLKKFVKFLMKLFYKPLGTFPLAKSKEKKLQMYDFTLAIEPTISKFNSICEKIFDPMISGSIPVYYGQNLYKNIPENTYIKISKFTTAKELLIKLEKISDSKKSQYRKNIFNFLNSNNADKYRYSSYANLIIRTLLN